MQLEPKTRSHLRLDLQHPEALGAGAVDKSSGGIVISHSRVLRHSMIEVRDFMRLCRLADVVDSGCHGEAALPAPPAGSAVAIESRPSIRDAGNR
jgi:hypothetical protein